MGLGADPAQPLANTSFDIDRRILMCMCSPMPTTEHPTGRPGAPARVLLVENDFLIAETVTDQLSELGYAVVGPAYSLTEAIRIAESESIDATLLDWRLDGVTSDAVADILLERQIPFTFLTGYTEIADSRYRKIPLLKKPFLMEALGNAVEAMVGRRESGQAEPSTISDEAALPEIPKIDGEPYDGSPI
jgi:CheY-like chemotaxis protein